MDRYLADLNSLKGWDKNPRNINADDYQKLKSKLELMEQIKPLLITSDGTVLGGNMRLRAYRELAETDPRFNKVWVSMIKFTQDDQGLWEAEVNGHKASKKWTQLEDAYMEYSLLDNDRSGYYDADLLANLLPNYKEIDWNDYAVDIETPETIQDLLTGLTEEPDNLTDENEDKQPKITLTFKNTEDLENAKAELEVIIEKYNATLSVSAGEL